MSASKTNLFYSIPKYHKKQFILLSFVKKGLTPENMPVYLSPKEDDFAQIKHLRAHYA